MQDEYLMEKLEGHQEEDRDQDAPEELPDVAAIAVNFFHQIFEFLHFFCICEVVYTQIFLVCKLLSRRFITAQSVNNQRPTSRDGQNSLVSNHWFRIKP